MQERSKSQAQIVRPGTRPTETELAENKPVLPEIEHLRGKISENELDSLRAVLSRNADVFSKDKADIGCCNFVEYEIEIEEGSVPHREGVRRRMTPQKSEACRKEIEMLMEYDMIDPSKSSWACGVVMAKKKEGQLKFCCDFRYLNAVTIKDVTRFPALMRAFPSWGMRSSSRRWIWALRSGKCHSESKIGRKQVSHANWDCSSGRGCRSDCVTRRLHSSDSWPRHSRV